MQKWEYCIVENIYTINELCVFQNGKNESTKYKDPSTSVKEFIAYCDLLIMTLDALGKEGWELVSETNTTHTLKRPLP
jgi:hypothetical protein